MRVVCFVAAAALLGSLTGTVSAADIRKAPAYAVPAVVNWSGLYVGGHLGYVQSRLRLSDPTVPGASASDDMKGFLGGGQLGFNHQTGVWVMGLEADFSGSNADATQTTVDIPANQVEQSTEKLRWTSLMTARLGYAFDRALVYAKGGVALGGFRIEAANLVNGAGSASSFTKAGWTAGAGIEYALTANWSVRAEYDYLAFGTKTVTLTDNTGATTQISLKQDVHQFKSGLNYRF